MRTDTLQGTSAPLSDKALRPAAPMLHAVQARHATELPQAARDDLLQRYRHLRSHSDAVAAMLSAEDMVVQSMPDASPTKWHLAHTTWFFETFLLQAFVPGYQVFHPDYVYLFNSYYETIGARHPRPQRGLLTRPCITEVLAYRCHVDRHMQQLLDSPAADQHRDLIELGMAHEEQHQELMRMDILHLFSKSPLKPAFDPAWPQLKGGRRARFIDRAAGLTEIGHDHRRNTFAFDNEGPRHKCWLNAHLIADRLVTNGEWLEFMADGGYRRPGLWLSDGWATVCNEQWQAPLYWEQTAQGWQHLTLSGMQALAPDVAVTHVSYYEACAYACWAGARLPTEAEWETAAAAGVLEQAEASAWQWTQSAYSSYPGYHPAADATGEYNGKFMINQMVLRGGAAITPAGHTRHTYRNFFYPDRRWAMAGVRLARDISDDQQPRRRLRETLITGSNGKTASDGNQDFRNDVLNGLAQNPKALSPKYFYDDIGSALFEEICTLPEYYPTRTETALLQSIVTDIATTIAARTALIEFGSGASDKTRLLLDAAPQIHTYIPIDISQDALENAALRLQRHYPSLRVLPLAGDFTQPLHLPAAVHGQPLLGFFPGSTIGNFSPPQAVAFLRSARQLLGPAAALILGADIVKDEATLVAAYDDAAGVTARFNKNLLARINRELDGNFQLDAFDHLALWNAGAQRMEMHLVSRIEQDVQVAGQRFHFKAGERLHTENSHKFTSASITLLAAQAGWQLQRQWLSAAPQFGIFEFKPLPE